MGPVFAAPFSAAAISTAGPFDLFHVTAPNDSRVAIREIRLAQYSEVGDAESEHFGLQLLVGTTSASTGAAITPRNVLRHDGAPSAGTVVSGPSGTQASSASATLVLADAWNVAAGWVHMPGRSERIILNPGERAVLRHVNTANDSLTLNGTLTFQELGKP